MDTDLRDLDDIRVNPWLNKLELNVTKPFQRIEAARAPQASSFD